jgi:hypothetical protein
MALAYEGDSMPLGDVLEQHAQRMHDVKGVDLEEAREAVARDRGYESWSAAVRHAGEPVYTRFERAADAIQAGDVATLRRLLDEDPELVRRRSPFPHHSTLLHHVAANGIEMTRQQQSPPNAVEVARLLLERGADPDATCDTYGGGPMQTTLYLLVSSVHPYDAGVQADLVEELCRGGASVNGIGDDEVPLSTAITFGYTGAVEALARCGARVDTLRAAAALGDVDEVRRRVDEPPEQALIAAAVHGRREVVELLLQRGPDLSARDPVFGGTAASAARYCGHADIAELLEEAARTSAPPRP